MLFKMVTKKEGRLYVPEDYRYVERYKEWFRGWKCPRCGRKFIVSCDEYALFIRAHTEECKKREKILVRW